MSICMLFAWWFAITSASGTPSLQGPFNTRGECEKGRTMLIEEAKIHPAGLMYGRCRDLQSSKP